MECWWVGLCNYNYSEQTATSITTTIVPTLPTSTATADRTENKVANAPNCQVIKTRFLSHYFSEFHSLYTQSDLTFLSGICKLIKFLLARILEVAPADEAAAVKYI